MSTVLESPQETSAPEVSSPSNSKKGNGKKSTSSETTETHVSEETPVVKEREVIFTQGDSQWLEPYLLDVTSNPFGSDRVKDISDLDFDASTSYLEWPPVVADETGLVYAGHRRVATAIKNQISTIRVDVLPQKDATSRVRTSIRENNRRKTAEWWEEALAIQALMATGLNMTQATAEFLNDEGKPRRKDWGSERLAALGLFQSSKKLQKMARNHEIDAKSMTIASRLPEKFHDKVIEAIEAGENPRMTVEKAIERANRLGERTPRKQPKVTERPVGVPLKMTPKRLTQWINYSSSYWTDRIGKGMVRETPVFHVLRLTRRLIDGGFQSFEAYILEVAKSLDPLNAPKNLKEVKAVTQPPKGSTSTETPEGQTEENGTGDKE